MFRFPSLRLFLRVSVFPCVSKLDAAIMGDAAVGGGGKHLVTLKKSHGISLDL